MNLTQSEIGPYQVKAEVGRGGMSVVYQAVDSRTGREVALKVLAPHLAHDEAFRKRFIREGQQAEQLQHPNIVDVFDVGEVGDHLYIAMELVDGSTLSDFLRSQQTRLPVEQSIDIIRQAATGLDHAHEKGFVHRDIKPNNLLVDRNGRVLISDFGVAKQLDTEQTAYTLVGTTVGTPAYMSPEQAIQDKKMDRQSDLYSLGVILYRMVTGKLPFSGTAPEILHAHLNEKPPAPSSIASVSPEMETIILKAMAKNPTNRFADGRAMAKELLELNQLLREQNGHKSGFRARFNRWLTRLRS